MVSVAKSLELLVSEVHGKDVTAGVDIEASSSRFGPQSAEPPAASTSQDWSREETYPCLPAMEVEVGIGAA